MSDVPTRSRQLIAEEAAEWFVELRQRPPGRDSKDRFVSWLTESPVHVEEYLAIAQVFGVLRQVDADGEIDPATLADETVVVLHGGADRPEQGGQPSVRAKPARRLGPWAAAAGLILGVGASALYLLVPRAEIYATRLGEQRSVVLEDGSMVSLNTSTTIEVAFREETRQVRLTRGEALFEVERDVNRPFLVETRAAVIRVTGTQFNVYDQEHATAVTVLEGRVEVVPREAERTATTRGPATSSGDSRRVTSLGAGDQALVRSGSAEIRTTTVANLEPVTAWTERRLVFDSTPLSEIVRQFNRYNRERLVIGDPKLASMELSGVFGSNDPQSLVLFLKRVADVEVVTAAGGTEIRIHSGSR